jgi:putative nucleotidyltransferase with HDIG domain
MTETDREIQSQSKPRDRSVIFRLVVLLISGLLALGALIFPIAISPGEVPLKAGDVASQDIQAPRTITYESEILTQQAREEARARVQRVYLPADPAITRRQIEKLRVALDFITTVRFDSYATLEQKMDDLSALSELQLSHDTMAKILALSDSRWQTIRQECLSVLEQGMRRTIREDQLQEALKNLPTVISFSLPEDQAKIVAEIVSWYIVPNSLYSEELTEQARQEAENKVDPVLRTYIAGETIVSRGQVITLILWEGLSELGLITTESRQEELWAAVALVGLATIFIGLFFARRGKAAQLDIKSLLLLAITFLIFLYGARAVIPNRTVLPYLFPISAFGLTVAGIFNLNLGLFFPIILSVLTAYNLPNSLDLTLFYLISSLIGVLVLGKGRRIANFFWAGVAIGVSGSAVILAYRLPDSITDWVGIATLIGASFLNGLASASLTLIIQYLFAQILGLTTALQLMDLLRPDHPLLRHILQTMPGSYQHSLQVANLAERAAEAVGADPLLTRVGAIFHDAGKSANPEFFIENQVQGKLDAHEEEDPVASAQTIIRHIPEGIALAKKYNLPPRIQDFIREHHGTLITRYQYSLALQANGGDPSKVDIEQFRYPGPSPRSRETALLMLADGVEARARAEIPKNDDQLREVIKKAIDYCQQEGQLDQTNLTLRDLNTISESFLNTLRNTYHQRIRYPEVKQQLPGASFEPETAPIDKKSSKTLKKLP